MAYSETELDALKAAYAQGIKRLSYDGKTVEYDSGAEILRRIRVIESEIAAAAGTAKPVAGYATFRRN